MLTRLISHSTVLAKPSNVEGTKKTYSIVKHRPINKHGIAKFGKWIVRESFEEIAEESDPTEMVNKLNTRLNAKIEEVFPIKETKKFNSDQEWMTPKLQELRRRKAREYRKHKRLKKFLDLQREFLELKLKETKNFVQKKVEALRNSNPAEFFKRIKKLGERPGENANEVFKISSHVDQELSSKESAEKIAGFFSEISQQYEPLEFEKLPIRVQNKLNDREVKPELLEPHEVLSILKKRKLKNSRVPGDIPAKVKREFLPELATPLAKIFNRINETGSYPRTWVREYVTPVQKQPFPEDENQVRPISLSADFSRDYNKYLVAKLLN